MILTRLPITTSEQSQRAKILKTSVWVPPFLELQSRNYLSINGDAVLVVDEDHRKWVKVSMELDEIS